MPVEETLADLVGRAGSHARELDCAAELAAVGELARQPGATRQRAIAGERGLPGMVAELSSLFLAGRPAPAAHPPVGSEPMPAAAEPPKPRILVVEDESEVRARIRGELERRYGTDYRVRCVGSATDALARLEGWREAGDPVALVLADQWMPDMLGEEFLACARALYPTPSARCSSSSAPGAHRETADAMLRAMARGNIDYYVLKPWRRADEYFHRTITEFLQEWERASSGAPQEVAVVCEWRSPRAHELRQLLARNGVPHVAHDTDSPDGRPHPGGGGPGGHSRAGGGPRGRRGAGRSHQRRACRRLRREHAARGPVRLRRGGRGRRARPGWRPPCTRRRRGSTPWSWSASRSAARPASSSKIRNYLGFARGVSGAELAQRAYQQAWIFGARFVHTRVGHRAAARGRPVRARARRRQRGHGHGGRAGHRDRVPAARDPGARGARRAPACSTAHRCPRPARTRGSRSTWWAAATRPGRRPSTSAATPRG